LAHDLTLFYVFAAATIAASLAVIGQPNPIYSVLLLIASFGALAGLYVLLDAPLVAVTQIIIYAGAILVLFLFVVMLLNVPREAPYDPKASRESAGARGLGAVLALLLLVELGWALSRSRGFGGDLGAPAGWSVGDIGHVLFTDYGIAFEATSILILVAMVGAVVLARRHTAEEQELEAEIQPAGAPERELDGDHQAATTDA
jgi:NADH-quinone oxidoreductase subunit J